MIQVSPPDEFGYVSLGVSVDVIPAAVAKARVVVAEVNPAMPRSMGASTLHLSQIHTLVPVDTPVIEYQHPAVQAQAMEQIARYVGSIIDDGSTLQIGLGRITNEALAHLADRRDIGIHSDVITDAIIPLLERGVPGVHVGQDDTPYAEARRLVGGDGIVGVTCHDSHHLAMVAAEDGADYVAFGAFFQTGTKRPKSWADPEILAWWSALMTVPCVAIGGITVDTCRPLIEAGADFLAVSAGVWEHPAGPAEAVKAFNVEMGRPR